LLEPRQLLAADLLASEPPLSLPGGATASISGTVFTAAHCGQQSAPAGQANVRVQLLDSQGGVLEQAGTDAQGNYHFVDLLPGEYAVRQIISHGFLEAAADATLGTQQIASILVTAGEQAAGYHFCQVAAGLLGSAATAETAPLPMPVPFAQASFSPRADLTQAADWWVGTTPSEVQGLELAPLVMPRPAETYGGSHLPRVASEQLKTWDQLQQSDWLEATQSLEIASSALPQWTELNPMMDAPSASSEASRDALFADGYTASYGWEELATIAWLDAEEILAQQDHGHDHRPDAATHKIAQRDTARRDTTRRDTTRRDTVPSQAPPPPTQLPPAQPSPSR
jgi:hypothetical protein